MNSVVSAFKNNIKKSVAFLYTKKLYEKKIPFKIGSKTAKYLKINLTKEVHELYHKSYLTLMKETEKGK